MRDQPLLTLDYSYLLPDVTPDELTSWQSKVTLAHDLLEGRVGLGSDFLGWLDVEALMPVSLQSSILASAARLRAEVDTMVVVGIGGSYLGARTVIEALKTPDGGRVLYAGQTLSPDYFQELLALLGDAPFAINVVSKSGTTTEPAIAFRLLRAHLEARVGKARARQLIVATTDPDSGALRAMAAREGYETFPIPPSVGGRYSVLSAVGLLPIAFAGIDVPQLVAGAVACAAACATPTLTENPAAAYAVARTLLYHKGKGTELLATFEPRLHYLAEWWKQLFGESEGKRGMGLFPASVEYTTDLHSLGQYVQEGRRTLFETFIDLAGGQAELLVPADPDDADGLNFLAGLSLATVNRQAFRGTALAHRTGAVPSMTITMPALTPFALGSVLYFFERACALSGYLLGVNPFDQPGVEAYKQNMFALLNKPGYQERAVTVQGAIEANTGKCTITFAQP